MAASVKVVLSALVESAQRAVSEFGDDLSGIRADAQVAQSGLDEVGDEMSAATSRSSILQAALGRLRSGMRETIAPAVALSSRIDDIGDEATESAARIGILQAALFTLLSTGNSNIALFKSLGGTLSTLLIPTLLTLSTTLVPIIGSFGIMATALGGVAAGFGLIIGSGVVAEFKGIKKALQETLKETQKIVAEFGHQFVPLIYDAINAIPLLTRKILAATGNMKPFQQALRDLGSTAMTVLPAITKVFFDLGRKALPYLRQLAGFIMSNARPAFEAILQTMARLETEFLAFLGSLVQLTPEIYTLGTTVLTVLLPALTAGMSAITKIVSVVNQATSQTGRFAPAVLRANKALSTLRNSLGPLFQQFKLLLPVLIEFGLNMVTVFSKAAAAAVPVLTLITKYVRKFLNYLNNPPTAIIKTFNILTSSLGRLRFGFSAVVSALRPAQAAFPKLDTSILSTANTLLQKAIPAVVKFVNQGLKGLAAAITFLLPHLLKFGSITLKAAMQAGSALRNVLGSAITWLRTNVPPLITRITTLWNQHKSTVMGVATSIRTNLLLIGTTILGLLPKIVRFGQQTVQKAKQAGKAIRTFLTGAYRVLNAVATPIIKRLTKIWQKQRKQVTQTVTQIRTALQGYKAAILTLMPSILGWDKKTSQITRSHQKLANIVRGNAKNSLVQLANTIKSMLMPVLGAGLLVLLGRLGIAFRTQLGAGALAAGRKLLGLVTGSTRVGKALTILRGRALGVSKILRGALSVATIFLQGKIIGLAQSILGRLFPVFARLGGFIGRIAGLLGGRLLASVVSIIGRFGGFALMAGRLGSAIALLSNPIGWVVLAIAGLAAAWKLNLFNIRDTTKKVFNAVKAAFRGDTSKLKGITRNAVKSIQQTWKGLKALWADTQRILRKVGQIALAALTWLWKNAVVPILNSIKQQWDRHGKQIMDSINQLFNFLKGIFKVALGALIVFWQNFGDEILIATKFIFDTIGSVINTALDVILTLFDVITDFMAGEWETGLNKIWDLAVRIFDGILNFVSKWGSGFIDWVVDLLSDALDAFIDWGHDLIFGSVIPEIFSAIIDALISFAGDFLRKIGRFVSDTIKEFVEMKDKAVKKFKDLWKAGKKWAGKLVDKIVKIIGKLPSKMLETGKGLVSSFKKGISNKMSGFYRWFKKKIPKQLRRFLPGSDAKEGPLSDLTAAGAALPETLAAGMEKRIQVLRAAAQRVAEAANPYLGSGLTGLNSAVERSLRLSAAAETGSGDTYINVGGIRVKVSGSATREDGEEFGKGLLDQLRTYNLDRP